MKILRQLFILTLSVALLSSCDFLRKIAGRPLSDEIEMKRENIEAEQQAHRERLAAKDSLNKHIADSLAEEQRLIESDTKPTESQSSSVEQGDSSPLIARRELTPNSRAKLNSQYYVIVGAFSKPVNAQRALDQAQKQSYEATLISYSNGFTAVGVCPSDDVNEACILLQMVQKHYPDAWILNTK